MICLSTEGLLDTYFSKPSTENRNAFLVAVYPIIGPKARSYVRSRPTLHGMEDDAISFVTLFLIQQLPRYRGSEPGKFINAMIKFGLGRFAYSQRRPTNPITDAIAETLTAPTADDDGLIELLKYVDQEACSIAILKFQESMTIREIGTALNKAPTAVHDKLSRGLRITAKQFGSFEAALAAIS